MNDNKIFYKTLTSENSLQAYLEPTKVVLTKVILFNRRRAGELSKIPLAAYWPHSPAEPME